MFVCKATGIKSGEWTEDLKMFTTRVIIADIADIFGTHETLLGMLQDSNFQAAPNLRQRRREVWSCIKSILIGQVYLYKKCPVGPLGV